MMRDALIIFRKEIKGLVKDRRTLFSTFILPLLVVPIIFIGMGTVIGSLQTEAVEHVYTVRFSGIQDERFFSAVAQRLQYSVAPEGLFADMEVVFPSGYSGGQNAVVRLVYDSSSQKNQYAAGQLADAMRSFEQMIAAEKLAKAGLSLADLSTIKVEMVDTAPEQAQSGGSMLGMMMPYFLILFLFAGSMGAGLDVTAGEKERGSLAALLVNQVSRTSIAMGKILHVMTVAICSAFATFAGLLIAMSMPNSAPVFGGGNLGSATFTAGMLATILFCLVAAALFTATVVTLLGSLAKTVKEANTYVMPVYLVVVVVGVSTMYMDPTSNVLLFAIPYVNIVFSMKEAFMGMSVPLHLALALASNVIYAAAGVRLVSALYNSERILQTV